MAASDSNSTGLMAFWAEIDAGYVARYREWHNCEHMPERVGIPGFVSGRRYVAPGSATAFFMMYETADAAVLGSQPYLDRLNAPTAWTRESLQHFRNPSRNIYSLVAARGRSDLAAAPYIHTVRFNAATAPDAAVERVAAAADVARVRLYGIDTAISGIETSERKIYGGGPGELRWLLLVETTLAGAGADAAPAAAIGAAAGAWEDAAVGLFGIDYALTR
jgi:hypothetical protein